MLTLQPPRLSFLARRSRQRSVACAARRFATLIAAAFVLLALPATGRADWEALGDTVNPGPSFYLGYRPDVADVGGTPYVAWREGTPLNTRNDILVSRWTGTAWQPVGQPLNSTADVSLPSITSVGGVPYVAFIEFPADNDDPAQVRVSKLNATGDGWVDAGGGSLNHDPVNGDAQEVAIGVVGSVPHVAFTEAAGTQSNLWVKKLQSGSWVAVGGQVNTSPISAFAPDVAGVAGEPYVSWMSDGDAVGMGSQSGLRVSRFSGSSWAGVGGKLRDGLSGGGQLAEVDGAPAILFGRPNALDLTEPVYAEWNGTTWVEWGEQLFNAFAGQFGEGSLATIGGVPHIAVVTIGPDPTPDQVRVYSFDGAAWTQVGTGLRRSLAANPYEPVIAAVAGGAVVTWREQADSVEKIHASQIDVSSPPETTIAGDSTATRAGVGSYAFTTTPAADATFECSYDDEPFEPCTSPHQSDVLDPGNHNFRVRASNANGTDPTPASRDFIVDRVAPTTTIRLDGTRTSLGAFAGSVTVKADVTDPPLSSGPRSTFCLVDPLTPPTSFGNFGSQPCGVVVTAVGTHTAYAIANDQAGNESAIVSAPFSIVAAPDTTITDGSSGTVFSVPSFRFASNVAGARFECRVDSGPYTSCSSAILAYKVFGLSQGTHTFEVRAIGPDGLVDPSPASRTFTIGTQALDGGCSFRFPFRGTSDNLGCIVKHAVCPLGSVCTRVGEANVVNEDIGISYAGVVSYALSELSPGRSPTRVASVDYSCWLPSFGGTLTGPPCPQAWTNTVIGKGQSIAVVCGTWAYGSFVYTTTDPLPGPDEARGVNCTGTISIRPATALEVAGTGTGTGVGIVVPGPGILGVTPLAVRSQSSVAGRAAAPKPPFRAITRKIKGEGVKELKLGLGPAEAKTLRTQRRLELTLEITFTPTEGASISRPRRWSSPSRASRPGSARSADGVKYRRWIPRHEASWGACPQAPAASIRTACDPSANPKLTHTLDDVTGKGAPSVESPLNTKKIESFCAQHTSKSTIDSVDDWIRCQRKAAEAAASSKMAAKFPDAPNVMEKMKNAIADLPPNPRNAQLSNDATANMDKLRRIVDANNDGQADLSCSQPDNS